MSIAQRFVALPEAPTAYAQGREQEFRLAVEQATQALYAALANHVHTFADIGGTIANAQVPASAVTQHQAALSIAASQVQPGTFPSGAFSFQGQLNNTGQGRFAGGHVSGSGAAAEIGVDGGGNANVIGYNRSTAAYIPFFVAGQTVDLYCNGTAVLQATSNSFTVPVSLLASGQGRFSGWYVAGAGLAAELGISAGQAYLQAYNRTTATYSTLNLIGSGSVFMLLDSAGIRLGGIPSSNPGVAGYLWRDSNGFLRMS